MRATAQAQLLGALGGRVAARPSPVTDLQPAAQAPRIRRSWPVARILLGALGAVQVLLAIVQAATGDLGIGHPGSGHLLNEFDCYLERCAR